MKTSTTRSTIAKSICIVSLALFAYAATARAAEAEPVDTAPWQVGEPVVTYWCGPALTDAVATQMLEGGFNLVWCSNENELDIARRHGLRGQLQNGLISPASLDNPDRRTQLDALIERVRKHPALYAYYIIDEPSASQFPALGKLVAYLRQKDPAHLAYINLFPTYANNDQLGTKGDVVTAYKDHLRQYVEHVKPALISYDHYQFAINGDSEQYFLNLAMIRSAAQDAGLPFLNIVQACTWAPNAMRIPNPDELRYLVHTTIAYGAQGISYYVYACANHHGSLVSLDGTPGPLYNALKSYNPEFVAIVTELQPLRSIAVYHTAMQEPGCIPIPADSPFRIDTSESPPDSRGFLLGLFGKKQKPTHAMIVNLDYAKERTAPITAPDKTQLFDPTTAKWAQPKKSPLTLTLPPGGGTLIRTTK